MADDEVVRVTCHNCSYEDDIDNMTTTNDNEYACYECFRICERCDSIESINNDWHNVSDEAWCQSCYEDYANWCDSCEQGYEGDSYSMADRHGSFCENCITNGTSYCDSCGEYYYNGCQDHDENGDDLNARVIHDYSYRPDAIFHSTDKEARLFFGMEIEVEAKNGDRSTQANGAERAQQLEPLDIAYLKSDGSLMCGFEIVTHPMTYDYFTNEIPEFWDTLTDLKDRYDMKSWATRTCGLHIHISRTGFNGGAHLHRFLKLVYDNQRLYEAIAGRSSDQWAKFTDNTNWQGVKSYADKVNNGRNTDRYSAINCQNRETVEMRIFKGSLKESFVRSALDLAHASVEYTRGLSVRDVRQGALSESNFMTYIQDNAVLYSNLNERMNRVFTSSSNNE